LVSSAAASAPFHDQPKQGRRLPGHHDNLWLPLSEDVKGNNKLTAQASNGGFSNSSYTNVRHRNNIHFAQLHRPTP
jgi:hypothetical protein